jgi:hypothetical protein
MSNPGRRKEMGGDAWQVCQSTLFCCKSFHGHKEFKDVQSFTRQMKDPMPSEVQTRKDLERCWRSAVIILFCCKSFGCRRRNSAH